MEIKYVWSRKLNSRHQLINKRCVFAIICYPSWKHIDYFAKKTVMRGAEKYALKKKNNWSISVKNHVLYGWFSCRGFTKWPHQYQSREFWLFLMLQRIVNFWGIPKIQINEPFVDKDRIIGFKQIVLSEILSEYVQSLFKCFVVSLVLFSWNRP